MSAFRSPSLQFLIAIHLLESNCWYETKWNIQPVLFLVLLYITPCREVFLVSYSRKRKREKRERKKKKVGLLSLPRRVPMLVSGSRFVGDKTFLYDETAARSSCRVAKEDSDLQVHPTKSFTLTSSVSCLKSTLQRWPLRRLASWPWPRVPLPTHCTVVMMATPRRRPPTQPL